MLREIFLLLLLGGLIFCAVATAVSRRLMRTVIIFMAYSLIMSVVWLLLEAPDLGITEAAVGAGVTGILFYLALRRIHQFDKDAADAEVKNEKSDKENGSVEGK
ncbi:MAG: DUF4040 domain-containing protein [Clostridiales bacterium]|jgi:energy-converting hydrogenase B subunit D|nr:DUF4040 domain-containing protein [Clostridiales bacterium]